MMKRHKITLIALAALFAVPLLGVSSARAEDDQEAPQVEVPNIFNQRMEPRFALVGTVKPGVRQRFSVNGEDFDVSKDAVIEGNFRVGAYVRVSGPNPQALNKVADEVVVAQPGPNAEALGNPISVPR